MEQKSTEQQQAHNLYFQTGLTQQQIADLINVNRRTLYTWIKDGCWKRAKYNAKHAPVILAEQYLGQLGALNDMISRRAERPYPTKDEAEIIRKISITLRHLKGDRKPVSDNIELFIDFTQHLRLKDKKIAEEFMPYMDDYIQAQIKKGHGLDSPWKAYIKDREEDQEYEEWLSQQPRPQPTDLAAFPPGYFTDGYQPGGETPEPAVQEVDISHSAPSANDQNAPLATTEQGDNGVMNEASGMLVNNTIPLVNNDVTKNTNEETPAQEIPLMGGSQLPADVANPTPANEEKPAPQLPTATDTSGISPKELERKIDEWRNIILSTRKRRRYDDLKDNEAA